MTDRNESLVEMTEEVVEDRLRRVSELTRLCQELKEVGRRAGLWKPDEGSDRRNQDE